MRRLVVGCWLLVVVVVTVGCYSCWLLLQFVGCWLLLQLLVVVVVGVIAAEYAVMTISCL